MSSPTVGQRLRSTLSWKRNYDVKPIGFTWRSHTLFIVSTVGVGIFSDLFLYGLVVPVLPFMLQDRIGTPKEDIQSQTSMLLTVYAVASVVLSPVAGALADKTDSRQLPFVGGLSALIVATVLLFVGQSLPVLIFARLMQGASSAFVWTVGLALCMDTVGPENLGKTVGAIFSFVSVGELFAPVIGGTLYKAAGLGAVAGVAVGILFMDLAMRLLVIEKTIAKRYKNDSDANVITSGMEPAPEAYANEDPSESSPLLSNGAGKKEEDVWYINPDQASIVKRVPILYCLTSPSLLSAQLVAFMQATIIAAFDSTIPTHAADIFGFDSLKSGLLFIPLGVCSLFIGPLAGWAVDKYGTKPVAVLSFAYMVPALIVLRIPTSHPQPQQIILYAALLALCGVGSAATGSPSIVEAGKVVDKFHKRNPDFFGEKGPYAQLYGVNSMVFCAGLSIGPELAGQLKDSIGYGNMNLVLAVVSGITALVCFAFLGGRPKFLKKKIV